MLGIAAVLVGTVVVALVAMAIAFPLSLLTALYISEYAPAGIKPTLVSLVDLMAAVPRIIYGPVGLLPHACRTRPRSRTGCTSTSAGSRSSRSSADPERRGLGRSRATSAARSSPASRSR